MATMTPKRMDTLTALSTLRTPSTLRVEHAHTAVEGDYHEMVFVGESEYRDALARRGNNGTWRWLRVRCNNPDCKASALVNSSVVEMLAKPAVGRWPLYEEV